MNSLLYLFMIHPFLLIPEFSVVIGVVTVEVLKSSAIRRHHTFRLYEKHLEGRALVGLLIVFRHDKLLV